MGIVKTFDKVSWHFPEGKGCPSLEAAKLHLVAVMQWLKVNDLLSPEGLELAELGVHSEFSLNAHMLLPEGNKVLNECYAAWLRTVRYGQKPSMALLDKCLSATKKQEG